MPTRSDPWPAGTPCWVDLGAPDVAASTAFYGAVLGWSFFDSGEEFGHLKHHHRRTRPPRSSALRHRCQRTGSAIPNRSKTWPTPPAERVNVAWAPTMSLRF